VSQKNPDVERALIAFGGDVFPYHSFGPFHVRPRVPVMADPPAPRPMMAPVPEPMSRPTQQVQPVVFQPAPIPLAPIPIAPMPIAPVPSAPPQPMTLAPQPAAMAVTMSPIVQVAPQMPDMPRPAAMMAAAPMMTAPIAAAASPASPLPSAPLPPAPPVPPATAAQGLTPEAERRSLDAMFRVLTARNDGLAAVTAAPQPVVSAQQSDPTSLFRRI
jgi:hypothetical protein